MKTNFTNGPWDIVTFEENYKHKYAIYAVSGNQDEAIAELFTSNNSEKNAHLIAAAPEMYELLDKINAAFYARTTRIEWLTLMEKTKPLLKKARGES